MPQSISIGLLVLGGVLLLVAIIGGNFKIFGAEVSERISSGPLRVFAGLLGIFFVFLALSPSLIISPGATGELPTKGTGPAATTVETTSSKPAESTPQPSPREQKSEQPVP